MRRSTWGVAVVVVVAAASAAVGLLWLPAVRARHDREWRQAGSRAVAGVRLPAKFREYHYLREGSSSFICGTPGAAVRCFVTSGTPQDNVSAVRDALRAVATGQVRVSCGPDGGFAVAPDRCRLRLPVDGSRLDVFLYARLRLPTSHTDRASDFEGTMLQLAVAPRN